MIHIQTDHLGGAAGRAAGLDGTCCTVADLEEAHQAGGLAAAGERLTGSADFAEVGAGAGTVLEQACLADPQIHDAAVVDHVVGNALDEAGVRLGMRVGVLAESDLAGVRLDIVVTLGLARDAVGVVETGVEPLRAVRCGHLVHQHVRQLVLECLGILRGGKVTVLLTPRPPASGQTAHDLLHRALGSGDHFPVLIFDFLALSVELRDACLAEILGHDDICGNLAPVSGNLCILHFEHDRSVGIGDAAGAAVILHLVDRIRSGGREFALNNQALSRVGIGHTLGCGLIFCAVGGTCFGHIGILKRDFSGLGGQGIRVHGTKREGHNR